MTTARDHEIEFLLATLHSSPARDDLELARDAMDDAALAIEKLIAERDALREELLGKCGEARICHALATARSENKFLRAERDALRKYAQQVAALLKPQWIKAIREMHAALTAQERKP